MKTVLTDRQQAILEFIQGYIEFNSYPPTYREICKQFNIASTFGVKRHIDALVKKGYINTEVNASRTISITNNSGFQEVTRRQENLVDIPVVGRVAAGYPILAEQNIEDNLTLDSSLVGNKKNCFGLKVRGDSMINAGIFEDDVVLVNPQKDANNKDIIVAMIADEATVKRYRRKNRKVFLAPENDRYPVIELIDRDEFSIIGKVIGVLRRYN